MDVVVENVTQIWGEEPTQVVALKDFSHRFRSGRFSCLLGPSGCGKSTLLMMVAGLESMTAGRIAIAGRTVERPRREVGIVYQDPVLLPWKTVLGNVMYGLIEQGAPKKIAEDRARALLDLARRIREDRDR